MRDPQKLLHHPRKSRTITVGQELIAEASAQTSLTSRCNPLNNYTGKSVRQRWEMKRNKDKAWEKIRVRFAAVTNPSFLKRRLCLSWPSSLLAFNITTSSPPLYNAPLSLQQLVFRSTPSLIKGQLRKAATVIKLPHLIDSLQILLICFSVCLFVFLRWSFPSGIHSNHTFSPGGSFSFITILFYIYDLKS